MCPRYSIQLTHLSFFFFFFNDTATTEIYTLSLHDALPISARPSDRHGDVTVGPPSLSRGWKVPPSIKESTMRVFVAGATGDRKSTRLNSSHANISYAVFCLKKKNTNNTHRNKKSHRIHRVV